MDLTTLVIGALVAFGLIGADVAVNSRSIMIEVATPPKSASLEIDKDTLQSAFQDLLAHIASDRSVNVPELSWSPDQGAGMALAGALSLDRVAYALKGELGFGLDRIRLAFYVDIDGTLRAWVSGNDHAGTPFQRVLTLQKGEPIMDFVKRCAILGISQIAPYATAIHLMIEHSSDKNFSDVLAIVNDLKAKLPSTEVSSERSDYDNLLGLIALFMNDPKSADSDFASAMAADPTNPVPFINAAFVDLQLDDCKGAADRMEQLFRLAPPQNGPLIASAYMTWAAAFMGLHQLDAADRLLAASTEASPTPAAFGLWAENKRLEGDQRTAQQYDRLALDNSAGTQNYVEVAALYFHLSWPDNEPVKISAFFNPEKY